MSRPTNRKPKIVNDSLIKTIRETLGISSSKKLALQCGVPSYIVSRAERDFCILDDHIYEIAAGLKVSADLLFYSLGKIPQSLIELIHNDPLYFKQIIDSAYTIPRKGNLTKDFLETLKTNVKERFLSKQEMDSLLYNHLPASSFKIDLNKNNHTVNKITN